MKRNLSSNSSASWRQNEFCSQHHKIILASSTAFSSLEEVARGSDTLFVTVPDGQISSVWDYMRAMQADLSGKIVCHQGQALTGGCI